MGIEREAREVLHFIDGEFTPGDSGRTVRLTTPTTGETIVTVHKAQSPEVDRAANAALGGEWGRTSMTKRTGILLIADAIEHRFDDFLEAEMLDTGKPRRLASHVDIPRGAANFRIFADVVKNVPNESFHLDTPDGRGALNYVARRPKGMIAVV